MNKKWCLLQLGSYDLLVEGVRDQTSGQLFCEDGQFTHFTSREGQQLDQLERSILLPMGI